MTLQSLRRTGRTTRMVEAVLRWGTGIPAGGALEPRRTARLIFFSAAECRSVFSILRVLRPHISMTIEGGECSQDEVLTIHIGATPFLFTRAMDMKLYRCARVMDTEVLRSVRLRLKPGLNWPEDSVFIDHYVYEYLLGSLLEGVHRYDPTDASTRLWESEVVESFLVRDSASDFVVTLQDQREEEESRAPKQEPAPESELVRSSAGIRAVNILKPEGATDGG